MNLNNTFGWFQGNSDRIHGYGKSEDGTAGLYESGVQAIDSNLITQYDAKNNFKAKEMEIDKYLVKD